MEKELKNNETSEIPPNPPKTKELGEGEAVDKTKASSVDAEVALETRIEQLKSSIKEAKNAFEKASKKLASQVWLWGVITLLLIAGAVFFAIYLLNPDHVKLEKEWTWQIIYYSVVRVTIIAGLFSLITYVLKLLSSHIQMLRYNEHKRAVIEALPGFVESGMDPNKRDVIFNKLVELVIKFDDTGIANKESELKTSNDMIVKLSEILLKKDK